MLQSKSDSNVYRSVFWSIIVFASVVSGGFFLHDNTSEFLKSTVQTTLDSMVPLSQVEKVFLAKNKQLYCRVYLGSVSKCCGV